MEALWHSDLRFYPGGLLIAAGVALASWGGLVGARGLRLPVGQPGKNLFIVRGLRLFLFGASLAAAAAGWFWQIPALVAAGLVIGFEETLETSIAAYALKREYDSDTRRPA